MPSRHALCGFAHDPPPVGVNGGLPSDQGTLSRLVTGIFPWPARGTMQEVGEACGGRSGEEKVPCL